MQKIILLVQKSTLSVNSFYIKGSFNIKGCDSASSSCLILFIVADIY